MAEDNTFLTVHLYHFRKLQKSSFDHAPQTNSFVHIINIIVNGGVPVAHNTVNNLINVNDILTYHNSRCMHKIGDLIFRLNFSFKLGFKPNRFKS